MSWIALYWMQRKLGHEAKWDARHTNLLRWISVLGGDKSWLIPRKWREQHPWDCGMCRKIVLWQHLDPKADAPEHSGVGGSGMLQERGHTSYNQLEVRGHLGRGCSWLLRLDTAQRRICCLTGRAVPAWTRSRGRHAASFKPAGCLSTAVCSAG